MKKAGQRLTLTPVFLNNCRPSADINRWTDKGHAPGLSFEVKAKGEGAFRFMYRVSLGKGLQGPTRKLTLGNYPAMSLAEAREKAAEYHKLAKQGRDPKVGIERALIQHVESEGRTFCSVADMYLDEGQRGRKISEKGSIAASTLAERSKDLEQMILARIGSMPVGEITEDDVVALMDAIDLEPRTKKYPSRVDRALKTLRAVLHFAVMRRYIKDNPSARLSPRCATNSRDRVLNDDEIRAIWVAAEGKGYPFEPVVKMLILTAQRRNEVGKMRWKDLNLDDGIWKLPAKSTKSNRANEIPLSEPALGILQGIKQTGVYVFSTVADKPVGGKVADRPVGGWSTLKRTLDRDAKAVLCCFTPEERTALVGMGVRSEVNRRRKSELEKRLEEADMAPWRIHDFRRTAASGMAELGTIPPVLSLILNHSVGDTMGVTAIYNRHAYFKEKSAALEAWAKHVVDLVTPPPNVVDLNARRRA
jgi:integrase